MKMMLSIGICFIAVVCYAELWKYGDLEYAHKKYGSQPKECKGISFTSNNKRSKQKQRYNKIRKLSQLTSLKKGRDVVYSNIFKWQYKCTKSYKRDDLSGVWVLSWMLKNLNVRYKIVKTASKYFNQSFLLVFVNVNGLAVQDLVCEYNYYLHLIFMTIIYLAHCAAIWASVAQPGFQNRGAAFRQFFFHLKVLMGKKVVISNA